MKALRIPLNIQIFVLTVHLGLTITNPPLMANNLKKAIEMEKKNHVKPSFYAFVYEKSKIIASTYGYNLVLHGSMNRDLDLIAIPWKKNIGAVEDMLSEIADFIGCKINEKTYLFPHRGIAYILDINRGGYFNYMKDEEYYLELLVLEK